MSVPIKVVVKLVMKGKTVSRKQIEKSRVPFVIERWKKIYALHNHDYEIFIQIQSKMNDKKF